MQSDEQIYELVAKELATSPRQGLLIKCMAKCEGSESKGKAMYIEIRVDEIKAEIQRKAKEEAKRQDDIAKKILEQKREEYSKSAPPIWLLFLFIVSVVLIFIFTAS